MKIGILTFDYCNNYGAVLQAYALRKCLISQGHDVSFGDYQLPQLLHRYDLIPNYIKERSFRGKIKYYISSLVRCKNWKKKNQLFQTFREEYLPVIPLQDQNVKLWIVGSDQVWNPKIIKGYDDIYYANGDLEQPYLFYAVSCPASLLNEDVLANIKNKDFSVGVREFSMIEKLNMYGITSELVLDPTLLLQGEGWECLIKQKCLKKNYIFSYNLSGIKQLPIIAKSLSMKYHWEVVGKKSSLRSAGPIEFINYVKYAEMTLVSSFHGVAFSIIFHRPFIFFPNNDERDERAFSLLKSLKLEQCIYRENNEIAVPTIDWNMVDKELNRMRAKSDFFLKKNINRYDFH